MYNIYAIYNKINGKIYVGITNNLKRRWREHKKNSKKISKNSYTIHKAIAKYGVDNFIFKPIEQVIDLSCANSKEIEWIKLLKINGYKLYNSTDGGKGTKGYSNLWTDERKKKLSEQRSGYRNPMYGVKLFGSLNGNYGKSMNPNIKEKLLNSRRKLTDEQIKDIIKLYATGTYTQTRLSKIFNISLTQVHRIVKEKSWGNKKHDEIITKKNLTVEDIIKIKEMYKTKKYTQKEIAKLFSVSPTHINKILSGKKWYSI
jgi:hypothetical protein